MPISLPWRTRKLVAAVSLVSLTDKVRAKMARVSVSRAQGKLGIFLNSTY